MLSRKEREWIYDKKRRVWNRKKSKFEHKKFSKNYERVIIHRIKKKIKETIRELNTIFHYNSELFEFDKDREEKLIQNLIREMAKRNYKTERIKLKYEDIGEHETRGTCREISLEEYVFVK